MSSIIPLGSRVSEFSKRIEILNNRCVDLARSSPHTDDDLRKTVFFKLSELLISLFMGYTSATDSQIINVFKSKLGSTYMENYSVNFFVFVWRNYLSEMVEQMENLLRSAYAAKHGQITSLSLSQLLEKMKTENFLLQNDSDFIRAWADDKRNPRHNNFVDHHKGSIVLTFSIDELDLVATEGLIECVQRITTTPSMLALHKVFDPVTARVVKSP